MSELNLVWPNLRPNPRHGERIVVGYSLLKADGKGTMSAIPHFLTVGPHSLDMARVSRSLQRQLYHSKRSLQRINRLLARQKAMVQNFEVKQHVKTLRAERRKPHKRLRSRENLWNETIPGSIYHNRNSSGVVISHGCAPSSSVAGLGERKSILDFTPVQFLDPKPLSPVSISGYVCGSLACSARIVPKNYLEPIVELPKSRWPLFGLANSLVPTSLQTVVFSTALADRAILKAQAKVFAPNLQLNEYIVEWEQVLRLLKDPIKTMVRFRKVLKKWTDSDAWIWLPQRSVRRFGKGLLVSKLPTGGVLMSMRTRRTVDVSRMSTSVVEAAANRWLQYRYGIAPLASDISVVMGMFMDSCPPPELRSKSARYWERRSNVKTQFSTSMSTPWYGTFRREYFSGKSYSAKLFYKLTRDEPVLHKYGLHPTQWIRGFYNAIPYSFVFDWFMNLDEWMTAVEFPPYIQMMGNAVTVKQYDKDRATLIRLQEVNYGRDAMVSGAAIAVKENSSMERKINMNLVQKTYFSDRWFSLKNIMTGLALSYQPLKQWK